MNTTSRFLVIALCLFIWSCDETTTDNKPPADTPPATVGGDTAAPVDAPPPAAMNKPLPIKHNCKIEETMLEDNQYWLRDDQTLVAIVADETTKSIDFGDSHRVLLAIDTRDCKTIVRETLPVNSSPDYPYYLSTNTYDSGTQVLCTQGYEAVICYDAVAKKLLPQMKPQYLTKREAMDAQSGLPAGLEMWSSYLLGNTMDFGAYAFDLSDKAAPKAVLPNAEFDAGTGTYTSLFLLTNKDGLVQGLIPTLNEDQDGTEVKTVFSQPVAVSTNVNKNVRNNRYIVLKKKDGQASVVVDMKEMAEVVLPGDVAGKNVQAILKWLRARK